MTRKGHPSDGVSFLLCPLSLVLCPWTARFRVKTRQHNKRYVRHNNCYAIASKRAIAHSLPCLDYRKNVPVIMLITEEAAHCPKN
jgi:hypothetical protein